MSILSFLQNLLPNFERSRILEDAAVLSGDLEEVTGNNLKTALNNMRGRKISSDLGRTTELLFHRRFPENRGETHLNFIAFANDNAAKGVDAIGDLIPKIFARDVTKDGLTYKKAAVIQYLSIARFFVEYTSRYLLAVVGAEAANLNGTEKEYMSTIAPADKAYLVDNLETYMQVLKVLSTGSAELIAKLDSMEDLQIVADKIRVAEATLGAEVTDPLRVGFVGPNATCSPIYKIRSAYASYQVARHNRNKELVKTLQLRLLELKDAQGKRVDPRLQQQIQVSTDRLNDLSQSVAEFEDRYGK